MNESLMLVTLDEVKSWLRIIDDDAMDTNLRIAIAGASAAVMRYIKRTEPYVDDVPADVRLAVICLVGNLIRDPDGVESAQLEHGYLPLHVMNLLYPLRTPTVS